MNEALEYEWDHAAVERQLQAFEHALRMIAHDLNNKLGIITGNLSLFRLMAPSADAALLELSDEAEKAAHQASERMVAVSRLAHMERPRPKSVAVSALIDAATADFAGNAMYAACKLLVNPDAASAVTVDAGQIRQALRYGLCNAAEAMPAGGEIRIGTVPLPEAAERYVRISVTDDGPGIEPATAVRVFEPFFTTRAKALGLGLTLARLLVERNGGRLEIETRTDTGTGVSLHYILPR